MSALNMVEICLPVRAVGALECATFENRTPPPLLQEEVLWDAPTRNFEGGPSVYHLGGKVHAAVS